MKIEIEFLPEARLEFDDAVRYYAARDRAVSLAFIAEVDYTIERILQNPQQFPETHAGCRKCSLKRYPYHAIFYQEDERAVVVALAHQKRRPRYWSSRLR